MHSSAVITMGRLVLLRKLFKSSIFNGAASEMASNAGAIKATAIANTTMKVQERMNAPPATAASARTSAHANTNNDAHRQESSVLRPGDTSFLSDARICDAIDLISNPSASATTGITWANSDA
jgi:predicted rRNA methylase YqxC with S4 and FtsJ domains